MKMDDRPSISDEQEHELSVRRIQEEFDFGCVEQVLESARDVILSSNAKHHEVASTLQCSRSAISHFLNGKGMKAERLVLMLTTLGKGSIDAVCPGYIRAVAAYRRALEFISSGHGHTVVNNCRITVTTLTTLYVARRFCLSAQDDPGELIRRVGWYVDALRRDCESKELRFVVEGPGVTNAEDVKNVLDDWRIPYDKCESELTNAQWAHHSLGWHRIPTRIVGPGPSGTDRSDLV